MTTEQAFWKEVLTEGELPTAHRPSEGRMVTNIVTPEMSEWSEGVNKDEVYAAYLEFARPLRGHPVSNKVFFETLYHMLSLSKEESNKFGRGQIRADNNTRVRVLKLPPLKGMRDRYEKATGHAQEWMPISDAASVPWDSDIPL